MWKDHEQTADLNKRKSRLEQEIETYETLLREFSDAKALTEELSDEEATLVEEQITDLYEKVQSFSLRTFFTGKYDHNKAYLAIKVGTGGKDAEDFAHMLLRMYLRFLEQQGWDFELIDVTYNELNGIKGATLFIKEYDAFGWLQGEHGVHRLVRLSPFNSKHTRETSFAGVELTPYIDKPSITIKEEELRIDIFRSSGPGGQSVNTTDSAVRITHLPTKITVQCQSERSQLQNKKRALDELTSRVEIQQEKEFLKKFEQFRSDNPNSFGHQIRSYVLHPYTMVKDHRTNHEESDVEGVLNGNIMPFLEQYLSYDHE